MAIGIYIIAVMIVWLCVRMPFQLGLNWGKRFGAGALVAVILGVVLLALVFVLSPLGRLSRKLKRVSQQLSAPNASDVLRRDTRPLILYLRSFDHDESEVADYTSALWTVKTAEEGLLERLRHVGPVVAMGKPGEKLQTLGAARMYVANANWQTVVLDLIRKAELIILRPGRSEGFWWEATQVRKMVIPQKVIFYFACSDDLLAFRQYCPESIPESSDWVQAARRPSGSAEYSSFLLFSDGWVANWVWGSPDIKKMVRGVVAKIADADNNNGRLFLLTAPIEPCPYCESSIGIDEDGYCLNCARPIS